MTTLRELPTTPPSGRWWVHICLAGYKAAVDVDEPIVPTWRRYRDAVLDPKRQPRPKDEAAVLEWLKSHPEYWSD